MNRPTLTLVRHATTSANLRGRYLGWRDPGLTPAGEREARRLGGLLRAVQAGRPFALFSSDLARARDTASLAFPGERPTLDRRIRELDFGVFDGLTYAENVRRHGERFRRWIDDPAAHPPPGGEALGQLRARVLGWLDDLPRDRDVVAVTHGGPLRLLAAAVAALPEGFRACRSPAPASVLRTPLVRSGP